MPKNNRRRAVSDFLIWIVDKCSEEGHILNKSGQRFTCMCGRLILGKMSGVEMGRLFLKFKKTLKLLIFLALPFLVSASVPTVICHGNPPLKLIVYVVERTRELCEKKYGTDVENVEIWHDAAKNNTKVKYRCQSKSGYNGVKELPHELQ